LSVADIRVTALNLHAEVNDRGQLLHALKMLRSLLFHHVRLLWLLYVDKISGEAVVFAAPSAGAALTKNKLKPRTMSVNLRIGAFIRLAGGP
jgi:hypothetical protein